MRRWQRQALPIQQNVHRTNRAHGRARQSRKKRAGTPSSGAPVPKKTRNCRGVKLGTQWALSPVFPRPLASKVRRWSVLFSDWPETFREIRTHWRREGNSNPRDPSGFVERNSARGRPEANEPTHSRAPREGSSDQLAGTIWIGVRSLSSTDSDVAPLLSAVKACSEPLRIAYFEPGRRGSTYWTNIRVRNIGAGKVSPKFTTDVII
jgi:hypothetical protein